MTPRPLSVIQKAVTRPNNILTVNSYFQKKTLKQKSRPY